MLAVRLPALQQASCQSCCCCCCCCCCCSASLLWSVPTTVLPPRPSPAAGRLLELVLLLERHWSEHRLTYPLVLLSAMAYRQAARAGGLAQRAVQGAAVGESTSSGAGSHQVEHQEQQAHLEQMLLSWAQRDKG